MTTWLRVLTVACAAATFAPGARAADAWTTFRLHGCSDITVDAPPEMQKVEVPNVDRDSGVLLELSSLYGKDANVGCSVMAKPYPANAPYPVYSQQVQALDPSSFCYTGGGDAEDATLVDKWTSKVDGLPAANCAMGYTEPSNKNWPGTVLSLTTIAHPQCLYYLMCSIGDVDQKSAQAKWSEDGGVNALIDDMEARMHIPSP